MGKGKFNNLIDSVFLKHDRHLMLTLHISIKLHKL